MIETVKVKVDALPYKDGSNVYTLVNNRLVECFFRCEDESKLEMQNNGYIEIENSHPFEELYVFKSDLESMSKEKTHQISIKVDEFGRTFLGNQAVNFYSRSLEFDEDWYKPEYQKEIESSKVVSGRFGNNLSEGQTIWHDSTKYKIKKIYSTIQTSGFSNFVYVDLESNKH